MNQTSQNPAIPVAVTRKLRMVRQRKMWVQVAVAVVAAAAVLLAAMGIAMLIDWLATLYDTRWRVVLTGAALGTAAATIAGWLYVAWQRGLRWERVALDVDRQIPQMEERWTTVTRLGSDAANPNVVHPAMLRRVASEAAHWEPHVDPQQVVSLSALRRTMVGLTAVAAALTIAVLLNSERTMILLRRFWSPASSISATELVGAPGNLVVGKGEPVELTAAVKGVPVQQAMLFMESEANPAQMITLVAHGDEPIEFTHRVRAVEEPFTYRFRAGDGQTDWFSVGVAERPEISELRLIVTPPAYTGKSATNLDKLPRRLAAMQKSELHLMIRPTVPLTSLKLQLGDELSVDLTADADGWYRWKTTLTENITLSPHLTETHGLTNLRPAKCQIIVTPDKPPVVKVISPDDKVAVRPDDTIQIEFTAQDDVGIGSAELVVYDETSPDGEPVPLTTIPIPLNEQTGAREVDATVSLDLSKFKVTDGSRIGYEVRVSESRDPAVNAAAVQKPVGRKTPPRGRGGNVATTVAAPPRQGNPTTSPSIAKTSAPPANDAHAPAEAAPTMQAANPPDANAKDGTAQNATPDKPAGASPMTGQGTNPKTPATSVASATPAQNSPGQTSPGQNNPSSPSNSSTAKSGSPNQSKPNDGQPAKKQPAESSVADNAQGNPSETSRTVSSERKTLDSTSASNSQNANPPNGDSKMANNPPAGANPGQTSPNSSQTADSQPPSSSSANPSKSGMPGPSSPSSPSSTPPPNEMSQRSLDVAQASSSQRMRLEVDQWAGSFDGQQREKLEIAIAPELAALDEALAHAQENSRGVLDELEAKGEWRGKHDRDVSNAEKSTVEAQQVIRKLEQQTRNTPYAFIGLQLTDIGAAHVNPARNNFWTSLQLDGDARVNSVRDGWQHVTRARQLVAELTGQFQRAQREFELAEKLQKVKKMYQVFIEDSFQLLNGQPNDPDRYPHEMAELKMDEEYLKRLREVLEMRRDMMAELARILADDPRLLQRFMDMFKNRAENLREELAALVANQQDLNREVRAWTLVDDAERSRIAQILLQRKLQDSAELGTSAGTLQDRYQTWLPLARESKDKDLESATKLMQGTANSANELSAKAAAFVTGMQRVTVKPDAKTPAESATGAEGAGAAKAWDANKAFTEMRGVAEKFSTNLRDLEIALRQMAAREDDAEIAVFAANRLVEARRLIANTTAWIRELDLHKSGEYAMAASVEQLRMAEETDRLAGRLGDIEQTLAGLLQRRDGKLPAPIAEKARAFLTALDDQAAPNQLAAVAALRGNELPRATQRQQAAYDGLAAAEKAYDEMMRMAVTEIDKLPVQDPIAQLLNDPTLDELLAALEQELPLAELLGINPRPTNLQISGDWMRPGSGSGSGMGSGSGSGQGMARNQLRQQGRRAQQRLDRSYKEAVARALKETTDRKAVAPPAPAIVVNWNKLVSELGDDLQQGRDKAPPEQFRRSIEQYFYLISRAAAEKEEDPQ